MLFFRISILFILLSEPVYYSLPKSYILDCDELVSRGDNLGLKAVEQLINPLALLYLDTAYAGHIVDWEFKQGFLRGYPYRSGYYMLDIPEYTLEIAASTGNKHACSNLLRYYCSIPKFSRSDTICMIYNQLYRFLPVFVFRRPCGLLTENKLQQDFTEWEKIAQRNPPVKYTDPSAEFDRFPELKPVNNSPDAGFIALQLALALEQIKSPDFTMDKIKGLRRMQGCLANKRFTLPVIGGEYKVYSEPIETAIVPASREYGNIKQAVEDAGQIRLLVECWLTRHNFSENMPYSQSRILVKPPKKAYFEIYYEFGMQAFRLTLLGNSSFLIEKTMEAID